MGKKSTNFKTTKLCSDDVYFFVPNIVQSTLFIEQHSLFVARDNNKWNQTYFYKSFVRFTTCQHFFSVVHYTPLGGPYYPKT